VLKSLMRCPAPANAVGVFAESSLMEYCRPCAWLIVLLGSCGVWIACHNATSVASTPKAAERDLLQCNGPVESVTTVLKGHGHVSTFSSAL